MSTTSLNALDRYTQAVESLRIHEAANQKVFDEHKQFVMRLIDAENSLRDAVAEDGNGISNGTHEVVVTKQTQTFVDPDELRKAQVTTLTESQIANLIHTQERPPRISIRDAK